MTGTFIDTIVICTLTGLSIVVTGAQNAFVAGSVEGVKITSRAWQTGLPWNGRFSAFVLMVCLAFFAFTTILGWNYYSERCLEYLVGSQKVHQGVPLSVHSCRVHRPVPDRGGCVEHCGYL